MTGIRYPINKLFNLALVLTKIVWQQATPAGGGCELKDDPPIILLLLCWCMSGWILMLNSLICV